MTPSGPSTAALQRDASFLEIVQPALASVEEHLTNAIASDVRVVHDLGGHVLSAGGKRLRPAMALMAAMAVDPHIDTRKITGVAAALELVHMATLVHDDVVDHTATRRGKPTANAVYGNGVAVITGDFLLARSMRLFAVEGDLRLIRMISDVTVAMSEGEVLEALATGDHELSETSYREIMRRKTAIFIEGCCRSGAILADADEAQENAVGQYGMHAGIAFQIIDDLLDYTGNPAVTGKPAGSDLREGRGTLPLLVAMDRLDEAERSVVLAAFGNRDASDETVAAAVATIERTGAYDATRAAARAEVQIAIDALCVLPATRAGDGLRALAEYVVERDR